MIPVDFVGESKREGSKLGVNVNRGVDVIFLMKLELDTSASTFVDLPRSNRAFLADFFSGEPFPGTQSKPALSEKMSKSELISWNIKPLSSKLNAGLHGKFSSRLGNS